MEGAVKIEGGFAEVEAGEWLVSHGQPAASLGNFRRLRRKGWFVRDRAALDLVRTGGRAFFALAAAPFLTHIPCAAPVFAVSCKVLVAPEAARVGAQSLKVIPMSMKSSFCVTEFGGGEWVVMATASRTARIPVGDGETLSARPEAVVAWTGRLPTGFCPRLGLLDILLPRAPRDLLLTFYGPGVVWVEGACAGNQTIKQSNNQAIFSRRTHGL